MTTLFSRRRRLWATSAAAALLTVGLVAGALEFSSAASADPVSCNTPVTSAPTGPATVSAASTAYGKVLVVGSGAKAGCSLYVLTSDQLHSLASQPFACGQPGVGTETCANDLWPALLTNGAPIAGPGVNPTLLGTVTRDDVISGTSVQQVTYAGQPLYFFFKDEAPGETDGANLFDNVVVPTGIWYLVQPSRGRVAPGTARLQVEGPASNGGTGPGQTVLAASMNDSFDVFPGASFPVYTFSGDSGHKSACTGRCAVSWPPVLTSKRPEAGIGVDGHGLGIIVRADGTHQVTYDGKPLYLFGGDAYIPPLPSPFNGPGGINGDGVHAFGGTFSTVTP